MTYPGKPGVYPTHVRMWGIFPQTGVLASDFTGVERRRIMDAGLTSVYNALFPFINSEIATTPAGRMTEAEKTQWAGSSGQLTAPKLRQDGAITFASATVQDKDPGILVTGTVQVTVRITPRGKAEVIEGTVTFFVTERSCCGRGGGSVMALNGTPWHFERLAVNVDGIGEVISHKSLDWDFEIGGEQATDRFGNPRGTIRGIYKGTAKIELADPGGIRFSGGSSGRGR